MPPEEQAGINHFFDSFDPDVFIATAGSKRGKGTYRVRGIKERLYTGHAYAITSVDKKHRKMVIVNPHNTSKEIIMSYSQFKQNFFSIDITRINHESLISNYKAIQGA